MLGCSGFSLPSEPPTLPALRIRSAYPDTLSASFQFVLGGFLHYTIERSATFIDDFIEYDPTDTLAVQASGLSADPSLEAEVGDPAHAGDVPGPWELGLREVTGRQWAEWPWP